MERREFLSELLDRTTGATTLGILLSALVSQGCKDTADKVNSQVSPPESLYSLIESGKITPEALFTDVLKQSGFKASRPPIISEDPDAPIFIILEDEHGSPKTERSKLELLRLKYGINFVGIEGWAGEEVDKKRGYQVLNGESTLVEQLLSNKDYQVLGLEEETLQERGYKLLSTRKYIAAYIISKIRVLGEISTTFEEEEDYILKSIGNYLNLYPRFNQSLHQEFAKPFTREAIKKIWPNLKSVEESPEFQKMILETLKLLNLTLEDFQPRLNEEIKDYTNRAGSLVTSIIDPGIESFSIHPRSKEAINILSASLARTPHKISIIVFGALHSEGLEHELQKRGNCSILAIK